MEIKLQGLEAVQRKLRDAPSLLVAKAFHQALDRAIGVLAAEVEVRTPEGEEGLLKESVITAIALDVQARSGQAAVGFRSTPDERTGKPQDAIAAWVEFGHRQLDHKGEQTGYALPHPFMRPAFDAAAERAVRVFAENLSNSLSVLEEKS